MTIVKWQPFVSCQWTNITQELKRSSNVRNRLCKFCILLEEGWPNLKCQRSNEERFIVVKTLEVVVWSWEDIT